MKNIIGNSCVSAFITKELLNQEFINPFCWNTIDAQSMYNLILYYDTLDWNNIELIKDKNWHFYTIIDNKVIINFDGNRIEYEKKNLKEIKHAYAMTIHKSQGSEFDYVLLPITNSYYRMLYNKLIYTAVSRAKKSLIIVGDPNAFVRAIQNNYSANRKTSLKDRIYEVYK